MSRKCKIRNQLVPVAVFHAVKMENEHFVLFGENFCQMKKYWDGSNKKKE